MTAHDALPVSLALWLAALLPILVLLVLLVARRWPTSAAAPVALATAALVAVALFEAPAETLGVAAGKGIWDALGILYVIWPSLILYQVANEAGAFGSIQQGVRRLLPDRLLVVLAFAWVLASFIQSIAGFGTPLAVTAPLLVGLGMRPVYAVLLPLIGVTWGNVFGSLGVPWLALTTVVELDDPTRAATYAALLSWIVNAMAGFAIAWLYGRAWGLRRAWPAVIVISALHGGLQLLLVPLVPSLANFIATSAALVAVLLLTRWSYYRRLDPDEPTRLFLPHARTTRQIRLEREAEARAAGREEEAGSVPLSPMKREPQRRRMGLGLAFAPYAVLAVLAVVALMVAPVRAALETVQVGLPFPATTTGYQVEREASALYGAFAPLTHPGTLLLVASAAGYALYRARGFYPAHVGPARIVRRAAGAALPATTGVTALLLISQVMDHAGEVTVLALGISAAAPALVFVGLSGFIGALGTLLTSSSTASNVLFGPLQETTAIAEALPAEPIVAAQAAGSAVGGAVAPGDLLLGATVVGAPEKVGEILRRALPWTIATSVLVAAATLALVLL